MKLTQEQTQVIINNGKTRGLSTQSIIDSLVKNGYEPEGVNVGAIKQKIQPITAPAPISEPNVLERVSTNLANKGEEVANIVSDPNLTPIEKGVGATAKAFSGISSTAYNVLPEPVRNTLDKVAGGIGKGFQYLTDKISDSPILQEAMSGDTENTAKLESALKIASDLGLISGEILGADRVAKGTQKVVDTTKNVAKKVVDTIETGTPPNADAVFKAGNDLRNNVQVSIAKKNVNPQLESSTKRLFLDGTKNVKDPVVTYDKYLAQSKKALTDIKQDPAISVVGEKMGNAFETVVKQRSAVGKVLGEELKANGKIKINIVEPKTALLSELKDSGLSYNPKTNSLTSFQGSKFAPQEVGMLDDFVKGVNALGDNPTVSQIDNFIAKTRSNLAFTKGSTGVMGTTNAERIINSGMAKLKETLNPAVNGNPALASYWKANKTYSELSDFVEEGSTFLGKKTLTGDFAKDASVAKSSVQSILNQGKKDFMIKLEALTGYKAIDDAVLALQAMADAGDFRGLSLLQAMSDTGIPTSSAGFTQKIIDAALKKGGEIIAGTPAQQTRAFLQDLLKNEKINSPSIATPTTTAKTGARTSKTK